MDSPILQEVLGAAEVGATPGCQPGAPAADPQSRWRHSGVPCITQYTPSGTYFGIAKIRKKQHRVNLGQNLKVAKREFRAWKAQLRIRIPVRRAASNAPKIWNHYAAQYRQDVQNRIDLAEPSKAYLLQRLKALEASWPNAETFKISETKPKPTLPCSDVMALTKDTIFAWAASYARCYSHTAYNNTVTVLQAVLQKAVDAGVLSINPAAQLVRLGEPERTMKWLPSPSQWDNIVDRMSTFGRGSCRRAAVLATLICYTGCRLSEARRIRWADVDFEAKMLLIHGSKGRKKRGQQRTRLVPLHRRLEEFLRRLRAPQQLELMPVEFVAPARECLGTLQRACRELGFRPLTHQDLRHVFATWCVEQGVDIPTVADMLGHRDGGKLLLGRYRHLRTEHLKTVGAKLNF